MKDEVILKKVMEKAVGNGYRSKSQLKVLPKDFYKGLVDAPSAYLFIIFSHEFAKAYWSEEYLEHESAKVVRDYLDVVREEEMQEVAICPRCLMTETEASKNPNCVVAWEYHIQQMSLKKHPLRYLEKFL